MKEFSDPLNIKNQKNIAVFSHNRLSHLFGFTPHMTLINWKYVGEPIYLKDKNLKKLYIIALMSDDFGRGHHNEIKAVLPKAKKEGYVKKYQYKQFVIYEKLLEK